MGNEQSIPGLSGQGSNITFDANGRVQASFAMPARPDSAVVYENEKHRNEARVHALPTYDYVSVEEASSMSAAGIRKLLKKRSVRAAEDENDASEIRRLLKEHWQTRCPVCMEDFRSGEEMKMLNCGHEVHAVCAFRYAWKRAESSMLPECSLCRAAQSSVKRQRRE